MNDTTTDTSSQAADILADLKQAVASASQPPSPAAPTAPAGLSIEEVKAKAEEAKKQIDAIVEKYIKSRAPVVPVMPTPEEEIAKIKAGIGA